MHLTEWITSRGGIAHRADAAEHGFSPHHVRAAIRSGAVRRVRAQWVALDSAPKDLVTAASASGRLSCVSLARHRGWWVPPDAEPAVHLQVGPNARRVRDDTVLHWGEPLVDRGSRVLTASVEDALAHMATCYSREDARAMWESAIRVESLDLEALRLVRWRDPRARALADEVDGKSDSGLETIVVVRLSGWGLPVRQQVRLAGHRVDLVIGSHLVIQIDGFAHHSSAAQRTSDVAHDAELRLRGYTVLRITYAQIVHRWEEVERIIVAAVARGLHLAPSARR
ncbi:endonuclease domain-containing protein [Microbacterium sp. NPDC089696]|uniref:endonuclease domain-containing protein n=1 Tax=Microbacterium sp. NPDC089696 TaxID=3364199 RepID=UPI00382701FC